MTQTATTPKVSKQRDLDFTGYHRAAQCGLAWCLARQNEDGSIRMEEDCFDSIYKFPAAFATLGRYVEAGKLLNWLENHTLTASGDLTFPSGKFLHEWHKHFYTYANSWIIIGAQRAGFFRLADRCMTYLLQYQDQKSGAFRSGPIESDRSGVCDTTITAQGGICALYTGHHEVARRAADALCRIAQLQDRDGPLFYFCVDRTNNLITTPVEGSLPAWTWIDSQNDGQCYWYLGIAAAFLCHMYELTSEARYLEASRQYMEFLLRAKGSLTSLASGKVGYAAALLYRSTGESRYFEAAVTHANWLVATQKPDGRWMIDAPDYPWYFVYDCTAEMAFWLAEIMKILSSPRGGA